MAIRAVAFFGLVAVLVLGATAASADIVLYSIPVGSQPVGVAVNPATNKIYATNDQINGTVTVLDGTAETVRTISVGPYPSAVAVNPITNKIYVTSYSTSSVTVIDGTSNLTSTIHVGTAPDSAAVNPVTNKIYVASSANANVTVIDGTTNVTSTVLAGSGPSAIAVNPATDKIYVANQGGTVTVIDGATNTTSTVSAGTRPTEAEVNPVTGGIYVVNYTSENLSVLQDSVPGIPLPVTIQPLPGRRARTPSPSFTFVTSSPAPTQVYYQVDTWEKPWLSATLGGDGVTWTATLPPLSRGVHILYAWGDDGSSSSSPGPSRAKPHAPSGAASGQIASYLFVVDPHYVFQLPFVGRLN